MAHTSWRILRFTSDRLREATIAEKGVALPCSLAAALHAKAQEAGFQRSRKFRLDFAV